MIAVGRDAVNIFRGQGSPEFREFDTQEAVALLDIKSGSWRSLQITRFSGRCLNISPSGSGAGTGHRGRNSPPSEATR